MQVILKQDIKKLGYTDDVVIVKNGYAMNYLIPKGMAVAATTSNLKVHNENVRQRAHKMKKIEDDASQLASMIENVTLIVPMKVGEKGKLYGSVTTQNLADVLKKMGHKIDKKQIHLPQEHIRQLGSYVAEIVLHRNVKVNVNFEVKEA
ncbi:MAG: 50S ribosomal protein L9 [Bacteroidia bacterium]|nr:50S ribosomal protein L9 [Bacteroidia bacterium]